MLMYQNNQKHSFHLVDPSPWPIVGSFSALFMTFGGVCYMHGYVGGYFLFQFGFISVLYVMFCWWRDVVREATYEGQHTQSVSNGLRMGMLLFIASEVMFFFAFFWAFFHSSFNPSIAIGAVWPPASMTILDPWKVPLLNITIKFWGICNLGSSCDCIWVKIKRYSSFNCYCCICCNIYRFTSF